MSACGFSVSVSVAVLLAWLASVTLAGAVTFAVLDRFPVAVGETAAVRLKVAASPGPRVTVVSILPAPLATPQLSPLLAVVQVQLADVMADGSGSVTCAPATVLGPLFVTT